MLWYCDEGDGDINADGGDDHEMIMTMMLVMMMMVVTLYTCFFKTVLLKMISIFPGSLQH
jgi:hypothetical protein